ncbi:MAG: hypothetical protein H0V66_11760 [Bdellovibrionales bacterium]|nr:hypothetical protein [Bdellovibrionales bacterium]
MKLLITLLALASTSVFANDIDSRYIKCYEAPQQTGHHDIAYKFKVYGELDIRLVKPSMIDLSIVVTDVEGGPGWQCLESEESGINFQACRAEGQNVNGLVPVEINEDETVYCERSILEWISGIPE